MGLQVPFAPYLLVFFFFRYCNYLFGETQTNKVDKTKQNKTQTLQWKHTKIAVQMTLAPTGTHSDQRSLLLPID